MAKRNEKVMLLGIIFCMSLPLMAQKTMTFRVDGENSFLIPELIALLVQENDSITVRMVMPPENREAAYRDVDLKKGDRVLMVNAERIRTIKDLVTLYESLSPGETLKLGVRRGQDRFIVRFEKMKEQPRGMRLKVVRQPGQGTVIRTGTDLDSDSLAVLAAEGLVLIQSPERIVIKDILPGSEEALPGLDIEKNDVLAVLNGGAFRNLKAFKEAYDRIAPNAEVRLDLLRGEKKIAVTYKKPRPRQGQTVIRTR
jgi:S1-C subfamily serine protease